MSTPTGMPRVRRRERWGPAITLGAVLVVWEALARGALVSPTFFPPPSEIIFALWGITVSGQVFVHGGVTLARVLAGFAIGGGAGLVLGLAMGLWPRVHAQLDPLVALVHPVPKIAALPLILVLFGIGEGSKVVLSALGAFFPMLINTVAGVRQISPTYFEVARSYGATPARLFRRIVLPGSLPLIVTGARLAINVSVLLTIAGELIVAEHGLGQQTWFSWQTMHITEVYAWLAVTSLLGAGLSYLVTATGRRWTPWRQTDQVV